MTNFSIGIDLPAKMKVHKVKAQPRKNFQAPIASRVPTKTRTMINYRKRVIALDEIVNNDDDDVTTPRAVATEEDACAALLHVLAPPVDNDALVPIVSTLVEAIGGGRD